MSLRPEQHIARALQASKDYYYLIASPQLQIRYEKRWHSQIETAERLYMPLFGRSFLAMTITICLFASLLTPVTLFYFATLPGQVLLLAWSLSLNLLGIIFFARFVVATHGTPGLVLRSILWPYLLAQDAVLYLLSLFRYASKTATWKGRPIFAQPANNSHYELNE
jgi:hypothetical protein